MIEKKKFEKYPSHLVNLDILIFFLFLQSLFFWSKKYLLFLFDKNY